MARMHLHLSIDPSRPEEAAFALLDQATPAETRAILALAVSVVAEWERRAGSGNLVIVAPAEALEDIR